MIGKMTNRFSMAAGVVLILCLYAATIVVSCSPAQTVNEDVVIVANGKILTMNPEQPTASAMAIKGNRIIAVGDLAEVKKASLILYWTWYLS